MIAQGNDPVRRSERARDYFRSDEFRSDEPAQGLSGQILESRVAVDGHDQVGLGQDRPQDVGDPVGSTQCGPVDLWAADPDSAGAQGQSLDHIGSATDPGVEQHRNLPGGCHHIG